MGDLSRRVGKDHRKGQLFFSHGIHASVRQNASEILARSEDRTWRPYWNEYMYLHMFTKQKLLCEPLRYGGWRRNSSGNEGAMCPDLSNQGCAPLGPRSQWNSRQTAQGCLNEGAIEDIPQSWTNLKSGCRKSTPNTGLALGMRCRNCSLKGLRINCQRTYWPRTGNNVVW
jgi:hypothetical protein